MRAAISVAQVGVVLSNPPQNAESSVGLLLVGRRYLARKG
jgi:hypothetical protein